MSIFGVVTSDQAEMLASVPAEPPEVPFGAPLTPAPGFSLANFEHNISLQIPTARASEFYKMERVNLAVALGVSFRRGLIASASIELTDGQYAEELEGALGLGGSESGKGLPSTSAAETITDMYRTITDGSYIGDPVWKWDTGTGQYYPDRVEYRDPRTITGALYHPTTGELVGFVQQITHGFRFEYAVLPIGHIVYAVDRPDAGPFGEGLKRACIRPHDEMVLVGQRLKALTYKAGMRALQLGYADVPDWAVESVKNMHASMFQTKGAWDASMTALAKQYAAITGSGRATVAPPAGIEAKPIGDLYDPSGLLLVRQSCHAEILQRFGAGHLNLGSRGTGGTYNLGAIQADAAEASARADVKRLCRAYNRGIVSRWYDYNHPEVPNSERAQVTFSGLDSARIQRTLDVLTKGYELLSMPGLSLADHEHIRNAARLPDMDEREAGLVSVRSQVAAATGGQLAAAARLERRRVAAEQAQEDEDEDE